MNAKDILGAVRDGAATFAGLSAVVYACGYLALRARAHALGVDPGFALVDEAYVFAGFRFVLTTLIVLLLSQPVVAVLDALAIRLGRHERLGPVAAWAALVFLGAAVLLQSGVLNVRDLLLTREGLGPIDRAALGQNNLGLLIFFGALISAQLLALAWVRRIRRGEAGGMSAPLTLMLALQLLYLPVLQGVLFADRYVRVLDAAPRSAPGLLGRVAIVDRAKDKVSLLGVVSDHGPRLVTVNSSDVDGIGVGQIVTLSQFLKMISVAPAAFALSAAAPVGAQPAQTPSAAAVGGKRSARERPVLANGRLPTAAHAREHRIPGREPRGPRRDLRGRASAEQTAVAAAGEPVRRLLLAGHRGPGRGLRPPGAPAGAP